MKAPHARSEDDKASLDDLVEAIGALQQAEEGLRKAMGGAGREEREKFVFHVGFARGRLWRVSERIYQAGETPSYICPRCAWVSYNPKDIETRYCSRCHRFADQEEDG